MGHSISMLVNAVAELVRAIPIKAEILMVMNLLKKTLKVRYDWYSVRTVTAWNTSPY